MSEHNADYVPERAMDRMRLQQLQEWRKVADQLAEAIRSHGPFVDDQCKDALMAYDRLEMLEQNT